MSSHRFVRREQRDHDADAAAAASVKRYWPGRAPHWVDEDAVEAPVQEVSVFARAEKSEAQAPIGVAPPVVVKKADDPRLQRLQQVKREPGAAFEGRGRHRDVAAPQVVSRHRHPEADADQATLADRPDEAAEAESSDTEVEGDVAHIAEPDSEEEEATAARRAAVRERLKARRDQEEEVLAVQASDEEDESSSGEYETDSEEEGLGRQMLKPTFTRKQDRETIAEWERQQEDEERAQQKEKQRLVDRKVETRQIVNEQVAMEKATQLAAKAGPSGMDDVDTDDEKDEETEYELWKGREMGRIRREKEERERMLLEEQEREMLKSMTEDERRQWERDHPKQADGDPKKSWRFLQKYWHKGAYFQSGSDNAYADSRRDEIFGRDYSAPTGDDKMDKSVLPKVMQVKNFGRRGRTKYTHLVDQDTTEMEDPLSVDPTVRAKRTLAGTGNVFSKPKNAPT
ncbi:hypothetical protein WJX73_006930 [Symbiochloris irregularis]|uniref:Micro-fibrillar-associated protein 1 C-terminal domain-containing protein n=1 Tax=Symbiochloris irregularis TaxID=706552 RepID=A0AAW1PAI8_9CHLO